MASSPPNSVLFVCVGPLHWVNSQGLPPTPLVTPGRPGLNFLRVPYPVLLSYSFFSVSSSCMNMLIDTLSIKIFQLHIIKWGKLVHHPKYLICILIQYIDRYLQQTYVTGIPETPDCDCSHSGAIWWWISLMGGYSYPPASQGVGQKNEDPMSVSFPTRIVLLRPS